MGTSPCGRRAPQGRQWHALPQEGSCARTLGRPPDVVQRPSAPHAAQRCAGPAAAGGPLRSCGSYGPRAGAAARDRPRAPACMTPALHLLPWGVRAVLSYKTRRLFLGSPGHASRPLELYAAAQAYEMPETRLDTPWRIPKSASVLYRSSRPRVVYNAGGLDELCEQIGWDPPPHGLARQRECVPRGSCCGRATGRGRGLPGSPVGQSNETASMPAGPQDWTRDWAYLEQRQALRHPRAGMRGTGREHTLRGRGFPCRIAPSTKRCSISAR